MSYVTLVFQQLIGYSRAKAPVLGADRRPLGDGFLRWGVPSLG
jgi:hypothetical protein